MGNGYLISSGTRTRNHGFLHQYRSSWKASGVQIRITKNMTFRSCSLLGRHFVYGFIRVIAAPTCLNTGIGAKIKSWHSICQLRETVTFLRVTVTPHQSISSFRRSYFRNNRHSICFAPSESRLSRRPRCCHASLTKEIGVDTPTATGSPPSGGAVYINKAGEVTADAQGRHLAYDNAGCLIHATSAFGVRGLAAMPAPHSLNRFSRYHCAATIQRAPGTV